MISRNLIGPQDQEGVYDNKAGVLPNKLSKMSMRKPSFDDPTYSSLCRNKSLSVEKPGESVEMTSG